jgi:pantoate--beta-alanine ligase
MVTQLHTHEEIRRYRQAHPNTCDAPWILVPTMGNLHAGHMALVEKAHTLGKQVIVSIFVNPTQFAPSEDFSRYPRTLEADIALCKQHGVQAVFTPTAEVLYPLGYSFATEPESGFRVQPPASFTHRYCGASRPEHFTGVATVVLKLFNLIQPSYAVFGEKDAQQVAVLKAMVEDLCLGVSLETIPVVRDADGLALSSRNQYLRNAEEREAALSLYRLLVGLKERLNTSSLESLPLQPTMEDVLQEVVTPALHQTAGGITPAWEYIACVNEATFAEVDSLQAGHRLLVAARVGSVRLIDTLLL